MRAYMEALCAAGRVRIVEREVSGKHELAAVTQRSQRESDLPLLFLRVAGSTHPVMTNVFGSRARLLEMLGGGNSFCRRWVELMSQPVVPPVMADESERLTELRLTDLPQIT